MKIKILIAFLWLSIDGFSQVEVKVSPIQFLLGGFSATTEIGISNKISIASIAGFSDEDNIESYYKERNYKIGIDLKYFFKPSVGINNLYIAPYTRYQERVRSVSNDKTVRKRLGIGLSAGYKWVPRGGLVMELAVGAGKYYTLNSSTSTSPRTKYIALLAIGYRFGKLK